MGHIDTQPPHYCSVELGPRVIKEPRSFDGKRIHVKVVWLKHEFEVLLHVGLDCLYVQVLVAPYVY